MTTVVINVVPNVVTNGRSMTMMTSKHGGSKKRQKLVGKRLLCLLSFFISSYGRKLCEPPQSAHQLSTLRLAISFVFIFIQLKRGQLIFISYGKWLFKSFHPALYSVLSVKVVY